MSRYKFKKLNIEETEEKQPLPTQGKSFLEVLLHETTGDDFPEELENETFAEIAIPDRNKKKKHLKFLRFPKLKEMLDTLSPEEPEKPDGYVIMDEEKSLSSSEMEAIQEEASERDDTEEFLNKIEDRLKYFGKIGRRHNKSGSNRETADEEAFEAGIVRSITQDENIISETLAKLLAEQGQIVKAIKMYEALILKFPEKSIYFAKKIKALK